MCTDLTLFIARFSPPWRFLHKLVIITVHFSKSFWKWVEGLWGWSWVILIPPYSPCPLLNLIPVPVLYCVLCLSPEARTRTFVLEKCCPTSVWPPSPTHPVLSQQSLSGSTASWLLVLICTNTH